MDAAGAAHGSERAALEAEEDERPRLQRADRRPGGVGEGADGLDLVNEDEPEQVDRVDAGAGDDAAAGDRDHSPWAATISPRAPSSTSRRASRWSGWWRRW